MDSLNSLQIGFYSLLSYSYDIGANGLSRGKQKEKILSLFLFFIPLFDNSKHGTFLIVFVLKYKHYLYVLVACVYCAETKDMPTSSRVLALG
jgi:hypothetical protein